MRRGKTACWWMVVALAACAAGAFPALAITTALAPASNDRPRNNLVKPANAPKREEPKRDEPKREEPRPAPKPARADNATGPRNNLVKPTPTPRERARDRASAREPLGRGSALDDAGSAPRSGLVRNPRPRRPGPLDEPLPPPRSTLVQPARPDRDHGRDHADDDWRRRWRERDRFWGNGWGGWNHAYAWPRRSWSSWRSGYGYGYGYGHGYGSGWSLSVYSSSSSCCRRSWCVHRPRPWADPCNDYGYDWRSDPWWSFRDQLRWYGSTAPGFGGRYWSRPGSLSTGAWWETSDLDGYDSTLDPTLVDRVDPRSIAPIVVDEPSPADPPPTSSAALERHLRFHADRVTPFVLVAADHTKRGRYDEAVGVLRRAVLSSPETFAAGVVIDALDEQPQQVQDVKYALAILREPPRRAVRLQDAEFMTAALHGALGETREARAAIARAQAAGDNDASTAALALALERSLR